MDRKTYPARFCVVSNNQPTNSMNSTPSFLETQLVNFAMANDLTPQQASGLKYCVERIMKVMGMTQNSVLWEMQTNPKLAA